MNIFSRVSLFALGPLFGTACRAVGIAGVAEGASAVTRFLTERLTDQSLRVVDTLRSASDQAWRTLELALAGESLLNTTDRADDKAFREQVRLFLLNSQFEGRAVADRDFNARCLAELRAARTEGILGGETDPAALATRLGDLTRFGDPAALVAAQWMIADELAADLNARGYTTLGSFITLRPASEGAEPLLAVAVRYHFRRAVEEDPRLFQGLAFAQLERIGKSQEDNSATLAAVMSRLNELHSALVELPLATEIAETQPSVADRFREQTNGKLAVSPDGTRVLGGSQYDGKLRLFDARTGKELRRLSGHASWVTCVAFSADGLRALSGSTDGVKLWDVGRGKLLRMWSLKNATPTAVAFTPDGRVEVKCADGTVRAWKLGEPGA